MPFEIVIYQIVVKNKQSNKTNTSKDNILTMLGWESDSQLFSAIALMSLFIRSICSTKSLSERAMFTLCKIFDNSPGWNPSSLLHSSTILCCFSSRTFWHSKYYWNCQVIIITIRNIQVKETSRYFRCHKWNFPGFIPYILHPQQLWI